MSDMDNLSAMNVSRFRDSQESASHFPSAGWRLASIHKHFSKQSLKLTIPVLKFIG